MRRELQGLGRTGRCERSHRTEQRTRRAGNEAPIVTIRLLSRILPITFSASVWLLLVTSISVHSILPAMREFVNQAIKELRHIDQRFS
jgi:hypothetical protein